MAWASACPFLRMISASASPCARIAAAWPSASAVNRIFTAFDLGFLYLDLLLFFNLLYFHRFRHHLLLHDVGLNVVRLIGLRLLLLSGFEILRLLDFEVARGLGLLGLRKCFSQHPFLIRLRPCHCGGAGSLGAFDS